MVIKSSGTAWIWPDIIKEEQFPELPPATRKLFAQFVNCANRSSLHPLDWQRFHKFVLFCHSKRVGLSEYTLEKLLVRGHFSQIKAARLAELYTFGRRLLAYRLQF